MGPISEWRPDNSRYAILRLESSSPSNLRRLALGLDQLAVDQALGDLNRVERGALAQVVGDHPHRQPILNRRILADAADIGRILADAFVGRDVTAGLALVDHQAAGRAAQDVARFVGG